MKAGTTSFHNMLNQHPEISMSTLKEPVYFAKKTFESHSYQWYLNLFDNKKIYKYYGESSVSYSKCHHKAFSGIPKRIYNKTGPDVKFIYILRDPINRLVSHFIDSKNYGHIKPSTDINDHIQKKGLSENNNHLMTSCYHYQLQEYLKYFSKETILLLEYEDIFKNTENSGNSFRNF